MGEAACQGLWSSHKQFVTGAQCASPRCAVRGTDKARHELLGHPCGRGGWARADTKNRSAFCLEISMKLSLKLPLAFLAALLLLMGAALFGIQQLNQALAVYETSVAQSYAQGLRSLSGSRPRPTGWRQGGARHGPGAVEAAGRSRRADRQGQCRHRRPGGPARQPGHHAQPDRDAGRVRCQRGGGAAVQPVGGAHQRQQRGR